MFIYKMGNFFKKKEPHLAKNSSQHVLERQSDLTNVAIYQNGATYYIQNCIQAKHITPSVPLHEYFFKIKKLNGTADGDHKPTEQSHAVPTFFSGSCKKNREQFNTLLSSSAQQEAHLKEFVTLFEPIIQPLTSNTQMLAKL